MSLSSSAKLLTNPRCRVADVAAHRAQFAQVYGKTANSGGGGTWKRKEGGEKTKEVQTELWLG